MHRPPRVDGLKRALAVVHRPWTNANNGRAQNVRKSHPIAIPQRKGHPHRSEVAVFSFQEARDAPTVWSAFRTLARTPQPLSLIVLIY